MNIKKRKFQAAGWTALALIFLLIIYAGWSLGLKMVQGNLSVLSQGERTTGTILSQSLIAETSNDPDTYNIKYTFTLPSGQEIIGGYTFHNNIPSGWNVGDQ